jgi:hypothetical protein
MIQVSDTRVVSPDPRQALNAGGIVRAWWGVKYGRRSGSAEDSTLDPEGVARAGGGVSPTPGLEVDPFG